jgi:5-(carboxyamino)imidazole ribonucleotide synthase
MLFVPRIDDAVAEKQELALHVSEKFNHVGLLAVEMFQTEDDEILVNEVAPRPHNSGHYSIEASYTSQFENHLRAILNLPLIQKVK